MKTEIVADRTSEIAFFRRMLSGEADERILLLQAPSSKGKSMLIRLFRRECPSNFRIVHLDFKGAELGLAGALHEFRELLGEEAFPRFGAAYQLLRQSINIANNVAGGTMDIAAVLNVDEQTRKFNLAQLNAAFFKDLYCVCGKFLVIFDTFEKAPPDLKEWINGAFLPHVPRMPQLCVVIAGQTVPEVTSAPWGDCCERRVLGNIDSVDEWHTYVQRAQLPHPPEAVKLAVLHCKGDPNAIAGMLHGTAAEWRR